MIGNPTLNVADDRAHLPAQFTHAVGIVILCWQPEDLSMREFRQFMDGFQGRRGFRSVQISRNPEEHLAFFLERKERRPRLAALLNEVVIVDLTLLQRVQGNER